MTDEFVSVLTNSSSQGTEGATALSLVESLMPARKFGT